jgi:hypothetical protein
LDSAVGENAAGVDRRYRSVGGRNHQRCACGVAQEAVRFRAKDSVGGTPTDAVGTTALPEKSLMIRIGAYLEAGTKNGSGTLPEPAGETPTLRSAAVSDPAGESPTGTGATSAKASASAGPTADRDGGRGGACATHPTRGAFHIFGFPS